MIYRAYAIGERDNPLAWPDNNIGEAIVLGLVIDQYGNSYASPPPDEDGIGNFTFASLREAVSAARSSPCKYVFVVRWDNGIPALAWGVHEQ